MDVGGHAAVDRPGRGTAGVRGVVWDRAVLFSHPLHVRHYLGSFGYGFDCPEGATDKHDSSKWDIGVHWEKSLGCVH